MVTGLTAVLCWAGHCLAQEGAALTLQWQVLPQRDMPPGGSLEKDTGVGAKRGHFLKPEEPEAGGESCMHQGLTREVRVLGLDVD